jgi:hypothetical protein
VTVDEELCLERKPLMPATDRNERLALLGRERLRISSCLGGDVPRLPQYFAPSPDEDVFAAFRVFVDGMARRTQRATDALTRSLIGAGRLLTGELSGADEVIAHLPIEPYAREHGAGYCLAAPAEALAAALPLPPELRDTARWLAGSIQQGALLEWLSRHQRRLIWDEARAIYRLSAAP